MKSIKIATIAICCTTMMAAQDLKTSEVPSNLMEKFQKSYTNTKDIEWEKVGEHYKVEFDINRMEHEIWYDKTGTIIKKKQDITQKELPTAILTAIKSNYDGFKIDSIEMKESNEKVTYEVELEKGWNESLKVTFSTSGKVLNVKKD